MVCLLVCFIRKEKNSPFTHTLKPVLTSANVNKGMNDLADFVWDIITDTYNKAQYLNLIQLKTKQLMNQNEWDWRSVF